MTPEKQLKTQVDTLINTLISIKRPWHLRRARHAFEKFYTNFVLAKSDGNRDRAAKKLGIGFSTLKQKIVNTG
ncbi:hypothetical protein LCGC14_0833410 [marine sediment metagenome]|uniref:DNA binding HTH domain-containing protein n=1 Tax=marine sediment metagenome TaxID=412755 RepID=A0A0F9S020_9ZZZZ